MFCGLCWGGSSSSKRKTIFTLQVGGLDRKNTYQLKPSSGVWGDVGIGETWAIGWWGGVPKDAEFNKWQVLDRELPGS